MTEGGDVPQPLVAEEDHVAGALRSPVPGRELRRLHRRDDAVARRGPGEVTRGGRLRDLAARRDGQLDLHGAGLTMRAVAGLRLAVDRVEAVADLLVGQLGLLGSLVLLVLAAAEGVADAELV